MNKFISMSGWLGLLFLITSLFIYLVSPDKNAHILAASGIGGILLIIFLVSHREIIKKVSGLRQTKYGMNSIVMVGIVIAILSLINSIAYRHKKRFDLTESGAYSISKPTKQVLKNLKGDIKVTGFFQDESREMEEFKDLLETYANESKKITYEFIDPDKNPGITKQYDITSYGTTVLESGANETKIRGITEEIFTNAIIKVTKDKKKTIYFLEGHGEHDIEDKEKEGYSQAKEALEGEGFEVKKFLMIQEGRVPEDARLLIINGPEKPLLEQEKKGIVDYLNKGGAALFMIDPNSAPGMDKFLKRWGVEVGSNIIIDTISKIFGGDFTVPVVTNYTEHEITKGFNLATFFPLARSVGPDENKKEHITVETLLKTSENSWGEVDTKSRKVKFDKGKDLPGPVSIGVVVTKELSDEEQTEEIEKSGENLPGPEAKKYNMIVLGDSDFVNNYYFNFSGNSDLFLNAVNWLMREENFITIRPKKKQFSSIHMTSAQGSFIFLFSLAVMPVFVIIAGIGKWWKRRRL